MCELYKDTLITIRVNGNIFYGPIKRLWQTYFNKVIEVFYNGEWFPAKIIGEASEKELIEVNDNLICSIDLKLKTPTGYRKISEIVEEINNAQESRRDKLIDPLLNHNELYNIGSLSINTHSCKRIASLSDGIPWYLGEIELLDEKSDWLFGIEFINQNNQYYTLTNGFIVSTK